MLGMCGASSFGVVFGVVFGWNMLLMACGKHPKNCFFPWKNIGRFLLKSAKHMDLWSQRIFAVGHGPSYRHSIIPPFSKARFVCLVAPRSWIPSLLEVL